VNLPNYTGYQAYQKNKYETASPHRLILMLYDGALANLQHAANAMESGNQAAARTHILKTQDILSELLACLNPEQGGEIAQNLKQLYLYAINRLVQANLRKDRSLLDEVAGYVRQLRSAWAEIGKEVSLGARPGID